MSLLFGQGIETESMQPGRYAAPGGFPHPLSRRDDFDAALSAVVAATLRSQEPLLGGGPHPATSPLMSPPIPLSLMYGGFGQTRSMLAASLAVQQQRKRDAEEMSLFSLILRQRALAAAATAPLPNQVHHTNGSSLETAQAESVKSAMLARGTPMSSLSALANPSGASPSPQEATKILKALGSRVRTKSSAYVDASLLPDPGADVIVRGGRNEYFPEKVYIMLEETEKAGQTDIVGWLSHGRAWKIYDQDRFVKEIMPVYFGGLSKYTSFRRQLNLWGFGRMHSGPDKGCLYHELFLRGREGLTKYMRRVGVPSNAKDASDPRNNEQAQDTDPDLRTMRPLL